MSGPLNLFDDPNDARPHALREPCKYCGSTEGHIAPKNGQSVVICNGCSRGLYNAPRTETGDRKTTGGVVHRAITRSVRAAVLVRAKGLCELCRRDDDAQLDVGHLLSVADGVAQGFDAAFLNSSENLSAMCQDCNQGIGARTLPLHFIVALLRTRQRRQVTR